MHGYTLIQLIGPCVGRYQCIAGAASEAMHAQHISADGTWVSFFSEAGGRVYCLWLRADVCGLCDLSADWRVESSLCYYTVDRYLFVEITGWEFSNQHPVLYYLLEGFVRYVLFMSVYGLFSVALSFLTDKEYLCILIPMIYYNFLAIAVSALEGLVQVITQAELRPNLLFLAPHLYGDVERARLCERFCHHFSAAARHRLFGTRDRIPDSLGSQEGCLWGALDIFPRRAGPSLREALLLIYTFFSWMYFSRGAPVYQNPFLLILIHLGYYAILFPFDYSNTMIVCRQEDLRDILREGLSADGGGRGLVRDSAACPDVRAGICMGRCDGLAEDGDRAFVQQLQRGALWRNISRVFESMGDALRQSQPVCAVTILLRDQLRGRIF